MAVDRDERIAAIRSQPEYWANVHGARALLLFPVLVALVYVAADKWGLVRDMDHWSIPVGGSVVLTATLQMSLWLVTLAKVRNKLGISHESHPSEDLTLYRQDVLSPRQRRV